jgi:hypothetical protein
MKYKAESLVLPTLLSIYKIIYQLTIGCICFPAPCYFHLVRPETPAKNRQHFPRRNINVLIDIVTKRRERYANRFFKNRPFPWEQMEGFRFLPLDGVPQQST